MCAYIVSLIIITKTISRVTDSVTVWIHITVISC